MKKNEFLLLLVVQFSWYWLFVNIYDDDEWSECILKNNIV